MDRNNDKEGVDFPFNKLFYIYRPQRNSRIILEDLAKLERDVFVELLKLHEEE